jgi:hypothetical protein
MRSARPLQFAISMIVIMGVLMSCASQKENQDSASRMSNLIASQNFKFSAQFATPLGGRQIQITGPYELVISKETITSFLPYYGVAYSAPMGTDESGIKFTSKKFEYTVSDRRSGWNIQIRPGDQREVRALNLRVTASGMATLQVTSNTRQSISYSGSIVPANEKSW